MNSICTYNVRKNLSLGFTVRVGVVFTSNNSIVKLARSFENGVCYGLFRLVSVLGEYVSKIFEWIVNAYRTHLDLFHQLDLIVDRRRAEGDRGRCFKAKGNREKIDVSAISALHDLFDECLVLFNLFVANFALVIEIVNSCGSLGESCETVGADWKVVTVGLVGHDWGTFDE